MATKVEAYVLSRFIDAVEDLATSARPIQDRLLQAMMTLVVIGPNDIPDELRDGFVRIKSETTAKDAVADEGTLQATILPMDDDAARALAKRLFEMYRRLSEMHYGIE